MREYKIYTENKNLEDIKQVLNLEFRGYTILEGQGVWKGISENSIVIIIIADEPDATYIRAAAQMIKALNRQESVLVTESNIDSILL